MTDTTSVCQHRWQYDWNDISEDVFTHYCLDCKAVKVETYEDGMLADEFIERFEDD